MGYHLGVDLGTTFVAAALATDTGVEMVTLGDRSVVTPAVVYLREDGALVCGDAAARRAVSNPDRIGREFKRRLGDPTPVMLGGTPYAVPVLLGTLLHEVLTRVTETEGAKPDSVVLTHPANWGPFRRELFDEVPHIAGLTATRMVTEPEAAAAHYAASRQLSDGEIIAVYDLGGGTFDATVLRKEPGGIEILGVPEGIERLGGVDFDESILSHVNYVAGGALSELDMSDPQTAVALARLNQDCVLAKEALSIDTETTIPVFLPNRHFDVRLTRSEFEDMIRAPIESTIGTLVRTLRSAQVDPSQLSAVLLVGGSSRIPLVSRMISEELGRPTVVDAHPKYAVALGAATLARAGAGTPLGEGTGGVQAAVVGELPKPTPPAPAAGAPPVAPLADAGGPAPAPPVPTPVVPSPVTPTRGTPSPVTPTPGAQQGPPPAAPGFAPQRPATRGMPQGPSDSGPPTGPPAPPVLGGGRGGRNRVLLVVAAVVALLAVVGGVGYVAFDQLRSGGQEPAAQVVPPPAEAEPPAEAAPTAVVPSASVPVPSLGQTVDVGPTSGFVVVSPNGRQAYVANRTAGVVTVVDTAVNRVTATIPVEAGPPQFLAFSPDGRTIYVSIWNEERTIAAVGVLDTTSNSIIATIPVRTRPYLAAVTRDGTSLYVPNHDSGTVSVIDTATNTVTTEIKVPPNPHWIEFSQDGTRAYIANHESNLVSVLDTSNNTVVAEVPVDTSPHSVAVHPTRPLVANVNYDSSTVTMIDTGTEQVIARIPVGRNPQDVTWAPDGRFAYTANVEDDSVSVISVDTMTVTATIPTGRSPTSVAVTPDGTTGYVSNLQDGTLTLLNLAG
ncbi:MAG TPA: Hsp70 family protein [Pseudonocardia sp.]|uniref:Hsp70 family protein n=1 Tax=Pseudonocardia sp. TaxID=60912 RepID=UPI002B4AB74C|nr:Hsp70 family protein [Pseudonocardia sp.]HLU59296.1 Hsp70 family protein [Pseudonocardia sp.]